MAERLKQQHTHKSDFHSETNLPLISNQVSFDASNKTDLIGSDDDLIVSLQSRRENCRARQVFEWEMTRRNVGNPPPNYYAAI